MTIGITRNTKSDQKFQQYLDWLRRFDPTMQFVVMSPTLAASTEVDRCDAVVLTGGGDVHPKFYRGDDAMRFVEDADERRDAFEFGVITRAFQAGVPFLGICRGLQVTNVHLGGSLHVDVEAAGFLKHTPLERKENRHEIRVARGSLLERIAGRPAGEVNSYHHQSASQVGKGLMVGARSADGVIESLEWADASGRPFFLLVQWHPERMKDFENPFAYSVGMKFVQAVRKLIHT